MLVEASGGISEAVRSSRVFSMNNWWMPGCYFSLIVWQ